MTEIKFRKGPAFNPDADVVDRAEKEISVFDSTSCDTSRALIAELLQLRHERDQLHAELARVSESRDRLLSGLDHLSAKYKSREALHEMTCRSAEFQQSQR